MSLTSSMIFSQLASRNLNAGYGSIADIPHFSTMKDMNKGAKRLAEAIRNKEKIYLVGDYDADGVCASASCISFFKDIGYPIEWLIPNRFMDGYGLSPTVLRRIEHADVVFTVDNGIVAHDAAREAKERGIDLIITDHHTPGPVIPDCYAVINPKQADCDYAFKDGSGCFVAWMLCCAIKHELRIDTDMGKYLDLVALSTITDVMPLIGINRHIVKYGLQKINSFKRPFFWELALSMGRESFNYEDLGFQIGPRINAAGRLQHASLAVEALLSSEIEAQRSVLALTELNQLRKAMQSEILENIINLTEGQEDFIVVHVKTLHEGIVGIVAAKVAEVTGYPTIILTTADDNMLKGSGRTVGGINIFALINECNSYLEKFGGHAQACGLSLKSENLEAFSEAVRVLSRRLPRELFDPLDSTIGEIAPKECDLELYTKIEAYAPFGEGNPPPIFHCREATVMGSKAVGKEGDHTKLMLRWEGLEVSVMVFNCNASQYHRGDRVAFNYRLSLNEWNGNTNLQFMPVGEVKIK